MISAACDRARAWVSLDLDGGLSTFEKRLLDRHLDACDPCRSFAQDSARFTLALRDAALEPAHVAVELPRRRGSLVSSAVAGLGAVAAVAAAAIVAFGPSTSSPSPRADRGTLASGLALLATNSDALGARQHALPKTSPARVAGSVRGTFDLPA